MIWNQLNKNRPQQVGDSCLVVLACGLLFLSAKLVVADVLFFELVLRLW